MNLPDGRRGLPPPNPRRRAYPGEHPVTPSCSEGYKWSLCVNDYQCLLRINCVIARNHRWHRLAYSLSKVTNGPAPHAQVISASIG